MKSERFIQFFDGDRRPILDTLGIVSFNQRIKKPAKAFEASKRANKIPTGAAFWAIHKTMLKSIIKLTELYPLTDHDS